MRVLRDILKSEKTNLGKLELVKLLEDAIVRNNSIDSGAKSVILIEHSLILKLILDEIKTKPTWGKNQLKDLFLDKIL